MLLRWVELFHLIRNQGNTLLPIIRACRRESKINKFEHQSYLDSLLGLSFPKELGDRKLSEEEIVSLCSEFLTCKCRHHGHRTIVNHGEFSETPICPSQIA
ncbi:hypothetical protein Sjap_004030 [Stephania japonica]|uniref:Uncharacterized protein n=1 Tax=Stephania japonica TaxID=461633 RepID=A0AAP0PHF5_9MAGN